MTIEELKQKYAITIGEPPPSPDSASKHSAVLLFRRLKELFAPDIDFCHVMKWIIWINDGEWHLVEFVQRENWFCIVIDGELVCCLSESNCMVSPCLDYTPLFSYLTEEITKVAEAQKIMSHFGYSSFLKDSLVPQSKVETFMPASETALSVIGSKDYVLTDFIAGYLAMSEPTVVNRISGKDYISLCAAGYRAWGHKSDRGLSDLQLFYKYSDPANFSLASTDLFSEKEFERWFESHTNVDKSTQDEQIHIFEVLQSTKNSRIYLEINRSLSGFIFSLKCGENAYKEAMLFWRGLQEKGVVAWFAKAWEAIDKFLLVPSDDSYVEIIDDASEKIKKEYLIPQSWKKVDFGNATLFDIKKRTYRPSDDFSVRFSPAVL